MSQLAQEKQVNLGTSANLNALSQYVLQIYFSDGQCIFIICQFRYQFYIMFCFFVLSPWMLQLIIENKLVCPRKLELDSSPTSCCSIVVVHCASLPIKKNMVIRSCAPLFRSLVPIQGIEVRGVGLRWDDDEGKSRIMCLWCECRCLRRMKGLSRC